MVWKWEKRTGASRKQEKSKQKTRKKQQRAAMSDSGVAPHDFTTTQYYIYNGGRRFCLIFPHLRRFFGFNTSCFWRWNVLYLYRDMGEASASPFFRHFPFKNGGSGSGSGKNLPSPNLNLPSPNLNLPSSNLNLRKGKKNYAPSRQNWKTESVPGS